MKYQAKEYAEAFMDLGAKEEHMHRLFAVMKKNGDFSQKNKMLKEIEKRIVKKNKGHLYEVSFARTPDQKGETGIVSQFGAHDRFTTTVDPSLIAGVRIVRDNEEELNVSLAYRLNNLFSK